MTLRFVIRTYWDTLTNDGFKTTRILQQKINGVWEDVPCFDEDELDDKQE